MAKITEGLRALAKANLVPEDEYEFTIAKVRIGLGDDNWELADCRFVNPENPSLAVRRISYFLGSPDTGNWNGLQDLLFACELEEVPDGDYGEQETQNLEGVNFRGRVYHGMGKKGLEAKIAPIVNDAWVQELMSSEEGPAKRRTKKKAPRRARRTQT